MKLAVDLHIHSALSPCGDNEMTPNNIVNMSYIKELDIISVTDHNTMLNIKAVHQVAKDKDILVIPGIEVTTKEEVHMLCYFKDLDSGIEFSEEIFNSLPKVKNKEELFGRQVILNSKDEEIGNIEKLLLNSSSYTIDELSKLVQKHQGIMIPAHIDKNNYSILSTLGFIPNDLNISTVEISKNFNIENTEKLVNSNKYNIIRNSDAHYLHDINEREFFIEVKEKSIENVFIYLSKLEV